MYVLYRLFATINSFAPTILRLVLALVFCVHGGQKTIGWMGGFGLSETLAQWTSAQGLSLSYPVALLGVVTEVAGALAMLLGFCTRVAGLMLLAQMTVAIALVHWQAGFLAPRGYEYPLTLGGIALALVFCGGGRLSVDRSLARQLLPPQTTATIMGNYRMQSIIKG
jgi:putative oxidoreductase